MPKRKASQSIRTRAALQKRLLPITAAIIPIIMAGIVFWGDPPALPEEEAFWVGEIFPIYDDSLKVPIRADTAEQIQFQVVNLKGKKVLERTKALKAGRQEVAVSVDKLSSGRYILHCIIADEVFSRKLIIQ